MLRELGGDRETIEERIGVRKWSEPVTSVSCDGLTFDMPDSVLVRIDKRIEQASSRLNTEILAAYKGEPDSPYPPHLVQAAAQLAAFQVCVTDGARTDFLREMDKDIKGYFAKISAMQLDLGILGPRPNHRAPAAYVAKGVGSGQGGGGMGHHHHHHKGCGC